MQHGGEEAETVGARSGQRLDRVLGVRHQPHDVAALVGDARDPPVGPVGVVTQVAGDDPALPLETVERRVVADEDTLDRLEGEGRVVARYLGEDPNGSLRAIAGISNERGNVVGLMPHPEHAVEDLCGPGTDGLGFFTSLAAAAFA